MMSYQNSNTAFDLGLHCKSPLYNYCEEKAVASDNLHLLHAVCNNLVLQIWLAKCNEDTVHLGIGRKTSIGNIETTDIRPPRHIGKDGVSLYLDSSPSCVPLLYIPLFSCNSRL